jgi:hypothetical protein
VTDPYDLDSAEASYLAEDPDPERLRLAASDPTEDHERYLAAEADRRWQEALDERYADYLADCAETGETPLSLFAFAEEWVDSLVAEAERRAEEGPR